MIARSAEGFVVNPTALVQGDICRGYGAALASSALAGVVAWVLHPLVEPTPLLPFLAAVTYSAYRGGLGPALVTTGLGALAATYLFLSPATFAIDSAVTAFRLTGYLFVALLISLAVARLYGARQQAERELNQVKSARADAEAALRVRDDFLALASHDLKNPLTAIRGHAQLLHRQAAQTGTTDGEVIAQRAVGIVTATNRMATVLNELLDLARLQLGQPLDLHRRPTDLVALTRRVAAEYHLVTERHQIRVEAAVPDLVGEWDSFRLERVLANLLSNAIKYSPR
ncbi:MAG: HAMP domain-containing histidine kinase, partial [Chloroflexi bacterium]|nr:HAMP domain-containing histidine kinase [Chloroflexota bacterium]